MQTANAEPAASPIGDLFRDPIDGFAEYFSDDRLRKAGHDVLALGASASLTAIPVPFDRGREEPWDDARVRIADSSARARAPRVEVVESEGDLAVHLQAWQELADDALEANVFYEPWLLRPAWKNLRRESPLRLVFVYEPETGTATGRRRLCGFFPLEPDPRFQALPVRAWRLWKHMHCFLCTPLVRAERGRETLEALFRWAGREGGVDLLDFSHVRGDGPFHDLLGRHLVATRSVRCMTSRFARALWSAGRGLEEYLQQALSAGVRKEYRRQRKRLAELGRLEFRTLRESRDVAGWLTAFLELEASGWKAREGQALGMDADHRSFFIAAAQAGFARRQTLLQGLFLDGRPVAMLLSFLAGNGGFAFKIAYDESLAKYSPGVQMMLDMLAGLHADARLAWMDSCADPDHPMINRLWTDQKIIESVLVSVGGWRGDLAVRIFPAGKRLVRLWRALHYGRPILALR